VKNPPKTSKTMKTATKIAIEPQINCKNHKKIAKTTKNAIKHRKPRQIHEHCKNNREKITKRLQINRENRD
jgi:hypothetical protein